MIWGEVSSTLMVNSLDMDNYRNNGSNTTIPLKQRDNMQERNIIGGFTAAVLAPFIDRVLSEDEIISNQQIDMQRFN